MSAAEAPVTVTTFPETVALTPVEPVPVTVPIDSVPNPAAVPLVTVQVAEAVAAFPCCTDSAIVGLESTMVGATTAVTTNETVSVCGLFVALVSCTGMVALYVPAPSAAALAVTVSVAG